MNSDSQAEMLRLQRELEARDKTIAVLIRRVEGEFAQRPSAMAVLEQNISLEQVIRRRTGELEHSHGNLARTVLELKQAQSLLLESKKLEAVGQLAAGVAHEINTPVQYVSDNTEFLKSAFENVLRCLDDALGTVQALAHGSEGADAEAALRLSERLSRAKLDWLRQQIPRAFEQSLEGLERVSSIVSAMKEFSHPSAAEKQLADLHDAIRTTITIARNEWKYVAELETEFDAALPLVPCLRNEFNQVILNLIVNAAHAIADKTHGGADGKGVITISTQGFDDAVEIRVRDTGTGVPEAIRARIYDPFFTTKPVGKGTGQGLAIARSVIVDKHGGTIRLESAPGVGTCFIIRLPTERLEDKRPDEGCRETRPEQVHV